MTNKGDLISREALKETIIKICGKCSNNITEYDENHIPNGNCAIWHILNMIDNAPTVEDNEPTLNESIAFNNGYELGKSERPQGEWIEHENHIECDQCRVWFLKDYLIRKSYCPNCGADMRGKE